VSEALGHIEVARPAAEPSVADFVALLKPRVMSLVVFTGLVGLLLAPGGLHPALAVIAVLCIALGAGAAGALNMWYERDLDALMRRTADRPIPAGRLAPETALAFALPLAVAAPTILGLATNWVAAGLLAGSIAFYVLVYTVWLKRRTAQNIVIGGAAGAMPPLVGWAAVTGGVELLPLALFALVFFWTPPHFWALALHRSDDYRRAGIPMLPVTAGAEATRSWILLYSVLLVPVSLVPVALGAAGWMYGAVALALGVVLVAGAVHVRIARDDAVALRLFGFSILYLASLFAALVVDAGARGVL
jgi:protoheme IX farnesyltransferase